MKVVLDSRFSSPTFLGDVCGSVILDELLFEKFLADKIGEETYKEISHATRFFALHHWQDYVKPNYQGPPEPEEFEDIGYSIPFTGIPDKPVEEIWTVDGQMNWCVGKVCLPGPP
jgi:hypothetical protein